MSTPELRRKLRAWWIECDRVDALRRRILTDKSEAIRRAEIFLNCGIVPPPPALPDYPEFPPECVDMVCGAQGRRKGTPCQCKEIFRNGRCKWHGGASTGPKSAEGKNRSAHNLPLPKVMGG